MDKPMLGVLAFFLAAFGVLFATIPGLALCMIAAAIIVIALTACTGGCGHSILDPGPRGPIGAPRHGRTAQSPSASEVTGYAVPFTPYGPLGPSWSLDHRFGPLQDGPQGWGRYGGAESTHFVRSN